MNCQKIIISNTFKSEVVKKSHITIKVRVVIKYAIVFHSPMFFFGANEGISLVSSNINRLLFLAFCNLQRRTASVSIIIPASLLSVKSMRNLSTQCVAKVLLILLDRVWGVWKLVSSLPTRAVCLSVSFLFYSSTRLQFCSKVSKGPRCLLPT